MSWFESIYADETLTHRAKALYLYLYDRSDGEGRCWPGVKRMAADLRISPRTVQRALADLERGGYLRRAPRHRENGSRTSSLYTILRP